MGFVVLGIIFLAKPLEHWVKFSPEDERIAKMVKNCAACGHTISRSNNFWRQGDEFYHDRCR